MTHTEALNLILAHSCPSQTMGNGCEFVIETHCVSFRVYAILKTTVPTITYDIVSCDIIKES